MVNPNNPNLCIYKVKILEESILRGLRYHFHANPQYSPYVGCIEQLGCIKALVELEDFMTMSMTLLPFTEDSYYCYSVLSFTVI
jgi:hypothetical protein